MPAAAGLLPQGDLVRRAAEYVLRIVSVLGLVPAASDRLSSFNVDSSGGAAGTEAWRPFMDAFADFRETVCLYSWALFQRCITSTAKWSSGSGHL